MNWALAWSDGVKWIDFRLNQEQNRMVIGDISVWVMHDYDWTLNFYICMLGNQKCLATSIIWRVQVCLHRFVVTSLESRAEYEKQYVLFSE